MSKHTPGPWTPEFGEAYRVRAQQDGGQVAIMMNLKGQHGLAGRRTGDEVAANARLIAAAPDLLEALQDCVKWYGNRTNDDFRNDDSLRPIDQQPPEIQRAMRAIAKANGEGSNV